MEKIEKIILDLTDCKYILELHDRIRKAFNFPSFYGRNLDALWDFISEPFSAEVTVKGSGTLPPDLKEYFIEIIKIFEENKKIQAEWGNKFTYHII